MGPGSPYCMTKLSLKAEEGRMYGDVKAVAEGSRFRPVLGTEERLGH